MPKRSSASFPNVGLRRFGKRSRLLGNSRIRARKTRIERKVLRFRPVRSSEKPVKVVFTCWEGFSSAGLALRFKRYLNKNGIQNISSHWLAFTNGLNRAKTRFGFKPEAELREILQDADIVFHFDYPSFPKRYLKKRTKNPAIFSPFLEPTDPHFQATMAFIQKHFDLR